MTSLRHRPFVLAGVAVVPTALSVYLIATSTKGYALADNLRRVGICFLQPLMVALAASDWFPTWILKTVVYVQFPVYAVLLWLPKTQRQVELVTRCLVWGHVIIVTFFSLRWLIQDF